jgi:periplasmic protein CpxP/Spy
MTKTTTQRFLMAATAAALLASAPAWAQTSPTPPKDAAHHGHMHQRHGEHMAERQAKLKAALKLTAAQEAAWTAYTAAHQPPANAAARPDRAEWEKLTTPQRLDKMAAMKTERDAHMARAMDATRSFYAALTPEQQKVFDAQAPMGRMGGMGMERAGHHGGRPMDHGGMKHGS